MGGSVMRQYRSVEFLVVILVIFSTLSLEYSHTSDEKIQLDVEKISGVINLDTRSSMDSLGLNDFQPGAVAELELYSTPVFTKGCSSCESEPVGITLTGNVNVSNLRTLESGGMVRIEGKLNVTHLQEFESSEFIVREWLTVDWDLAEFSTQWDIFIHHSPAKWVLDERYDASLVDNEEVALSRVGPVIIVEQLLGNSLNIRGCMPNSMNCDGYNREEINLTSTMVPARDPIEIDIGNEWVKIEEFESNQSLTENLGEIRNLFDTQSDSEIDKPYCLEVPNQIDSLQSWEISSDGKSSISPMGLWLNAIGLPSSSFISTDGVWTEMDYSESGCGAFSVDGKLLFGVGKS